MSTTRAKRTTSAADMAARAIAAQAKLMRVFVEELGLSDTDAASLGAFYRSQKLAKIDPVSGQFSVTHGRMLSPEVVAALLPTARTFAK